MATLDLNKMSDDELQGMLILYNMQVQENTWNAVTGHIDVDAIKQDTATYGKLLVEQDERNKK